MVYLLCCNLFLEKSDFLQRISNLCVNTFRQALVYRLGSSTASKAADIMILLGLVRFLSNSTFLSFFLILIHNWNTRQDLWYFDIDGITSDDDADLITCGFILLLCNDFDCGSFRTPRTLAQMWMVDGKGT